jgi:hypothetical protein
LSTLTRPPALLFCSFNMKQEIESLKNECFNIKEISEKRKVNIKVFSDHT